MVHLVKTWLTDTVTEPQPRSAATRPTAKYGTWGLVGYSMGMVPNIQPPSLKLVYLADWLSTCFPPNAHFWFNNVEHCISNVQPPFG
jgi:hypothetical protein